MLLGCWEDVLTIEKRVTIISRWWGHSVSSEILIWKCLKKYMHPNVHSNIIYNGQDMDATSVPVNRWMDKEDVAYTHTHKNTKP